MSRWALPNGFECDLLKVAPAAQRAYLAGHASSRACVVVVDLALGAASVKGIDAVRPFSLLGHGDEVFCAAGFPMSNLSLYWLRRDASADRIATAESGVNLLGVVANRLWWARSEPDPSSDTPRSGLVELDLLTGDRRARSWPGWITTSWHHHEGRWTGFLSRAESPQRPRTGRKARQAPARAGETALLEVDSLTQAETVRWVEPSDTSPFALSRTRTGWAWLRRSRETWQVVVLADGEQSPHVVRRIDEPVVEANVVGDNLMLTARDWTKPADDEMRVAFGPLRSEQGPLMWTTPLVGVDYLNLTIAGGKLWFVDGNSRDLVMMPVAPQLALAGA